MYAYEIVRLPHRRTQPAPRSGSRRLFRMKPLGTLDELPRDYVAELTRANLVPLWPSMRALLPPQAPRTATLPAHWRWTAIRPLLLRACGLALPLRVYRAVS